MARDRAIAQHFAASEGAINGVNGLPETPVVPHRYALRCTTHSSSWPNHAADVNERRSAASQVAIDRVT